MTHRSIAGNSVALGGGEKHTEDDLALLVAHTQQQFRNARRFRNLQRQNGLAEDLEAALSAHC